MFYSLSYVFFAIQLASAIPLNQLTKVLPRDVAYVALDEHRGRLEAYGLNGTHVGTYPAGRTIHEARNLGTDCSDITADELKTIPGYHTVLSHFDNNYDGKGRRFVANPYDREKERKGVDADELEKYRTMTLRACADNKPISFTTKEKETCVEDDAKFEGKISGADGQMRLGVSSTVMNEALWTTTRATSIANGLKVTIEGSFGPVTAGGSASTEFKITNSASKGEASQTTDTVDVGLWVIAPAGKHCSSSLKSKTCNYAAEAKISVVATGWIWGYYDNAAKNKKACHSDSTSGRHHKWAVNLDRILTQEERSSYIEAHGNIKARTKANYVAICE
ncbi:hypothetical protein BD779DRAFT_1668527 [Infundibulicybe gibba]|nr:hypothetical protein BD779DRAFT_1668527 [Infundibulicybe gibba]